MGSVTVTWADNPDITQVLVRPEFHWLLWPLGKRPPLPGVCLLSGMGTCTYFHNVSRDGGVGHLSLPESPDVEGCDSQSYSQLQQADQGEQHPH